MPPRPTVHLKRRHRRKKAHVADRACTYRSQAYAKSHSKGDTMQNITRRNLVKGLAAVAGTSAACALSAGVALADQAAPAGAKVFLHRGYAAAHGDKSFAQVVVATDEAGTIVAANIDEYQFLGTDTDGITPVPNAAGMAASFAEGVTLCSKRDNNDVYSALMADHGGATQPWADSIAAIEAFVAGKSVNDLDGVDTVAGCTLVDVAGYLNAVAAVAQDESLVAQGQGDLDGATLGRANFAAHGSKAFADAVTLVKDGVIVATSIDEFQCMANDTEGLVPVPNSDGAFGENLAEGYTLGSKSLNTASYSAHMAEKAGATEDWLQSMDAIEASVLGQHVDAVSGATLVDARAYAYAAIKAGMNA